MQAEQQGFEQIKPPHFFSEVVTEWKDAHVAGYRFVFLLCALIAIIGAVVSFFLVRREDRTMKQHHVFSRRSRWAWATTGVGPGISREPIPTPPRTGPAPPDDRGDATTRAGAEDP
jgi:hypothetical protein